MNKPLLSIVIANYNYGRFLDEAIRSVIAQNMGAGFLGGMLGGYLAGYFVEFLKHYLKVPKWAQGLMPMMIIPLISSVVIGLIIFFVVGAPIAWASEALKNVLMNMKNRVITLYKKLEKSRY